MAEKTVYNMHQQSKRFGKGVPIYKDPIFIIDPSEGADLAKTLDKAPAVIIKGHGIVSVGKNIDEACMNALYVERTAKMQAMAHLLGYVGSTDEFIQSMQATSEKLMARARELGRGRAQDKHSAEWNYYSEKVRKGEKWNRGWV
jgi:ribulose-5-phosphate 4-epimerase/fuculose-1-phosphate aldolase